MDVFLVPVGPDRYELYCEEPDEAVPDDGGHARGGVIHRTMRRFRQLVADAEHERRRGPDPAAAQRSFASRVRARLMRWVAESIAEQRLLWQLRGRAVATLVHPDDLSESQAQQILRRSLQRDWERHRFWLIIDALGAIGSVLLILLPGPNLLGYYFVFRVIGHYLSLRGARQGLVVVSWTKTPNGALTTLRGVVGDSPESRETVVREVATTLQLEHLAAFFQRAAIP
jgi:Mitochondrial K+-H+ exchange-related